MNSTAMSRFFPENGSFVSRFREAGDLTLDLLHRDGRIDDRWLDLDEREFECLWALATDSGEISAQACAPPPRRDRTQTGEEKCDSVDLDRLRAKLEPLGLRSLIDELTEGDPAARPLQRFTTSARR